MVEIEKERMMFADNVGYNILSSSLFSSKI